MRGLSVLWKRLFELRNRYHSLEATLQFEGLRGYDQPYTESRLTDELAQAA